MQANSSQDADPITAINIAPLVDVALVLVIIFMITMPYMMEKALKVKASEQQAVAVSSINEPILVELSAEGIRLDGRKVDLVELKNRLRALLAKRGNSAVAVSADGRVEHGKVVELLDFLMAAGASDLSVLDPGEVRHGGV